MVGPKTDRQWEIDDAANTLIRAEEIRTDKKLLKSAKNELVKRSKAIARVAKRGAVKPPKAKPRKGRKR